MLGAHYLADDGGSTSVLATASSPFVGVGPLTLHDRTHGSYAAASPDVLTAAGGGDVAFAYDAAGAPHAGAARLTPYPVVVLGFPFEAVRGAATRAALMSEVVRFLLPAAPPAPLRQRRRRGLDPRALDRQHRPRLDGGGARVERLVRCRLLAERGGLARRRQRAGSGRAAPPGRVGPRPRDAQPRRLIRLHDLVDRAQEPWASSSTTR